MTDILAQLRTSLADRYEIEREIGRGGMATVYLARDLRHGRQVAFKVLNPELGAVLGLERFESEIRVTASLQHPNLLPLFDSGEAAGLLFYVMPFISGESLRARLERERQLPVDDAVRIATGVASALDYAHRNGVIHRDLKPENILLQDGEPVIADFGIALAVSKAGGTRITQTGLSLGTPEYMSPEQATGDRAMDGRTDIYSLGCCLYEMLTGEPPHTGATVQAIVARVLTDPVRPVRSTRPTVPEHIDAALERALAKLPADRFATPREFAEAIGQPGSAAALRATSRMRSARGGVASLATLRRWQAIAGVAVLTAVAAGVYAASAGGDAAGLQFARQLTFDGNVSDAAISPDGAWLAYVTDDCMGQARRCTRTLKVREVDGTQSVQIATWPDIAHPRWSPDGLTLLFFGEQDSVTYGLYLTSKLGGSIRRAAVDPRAWTFDASGKRVVAVVGPGDAQELLFIDAASLAVADSALLPRGVTVTDIAVSPHSDVIAAAADFAGVGHGVALLSARGEILDSMVVLARARVRWASDGRSILAFIYGPGIADDLTRIPVSGGSLAPDQMTVELGQIPTMYDGVFDVAPTGRVAVVSTPTSHSLEILRTTDPQRRWRRLTTRTGFIAAATASPDGKMIAVDATDNLGDNIYAFPLAGGPPRAITATRGTRQYVSWSASSARVAYGVFTEGASGIVTVDVTGGRERMIQRGEPSNSTMWLGDSNVVILRRQWIVRHDTLARVLDSLRIPDSLGAGGGLVGNPSSGVAAWWSNRVRGVVAVNLATRTFAIRARGRLDPLEVANDGSIVAVAVDQGAAVHTARFVRIPPGAASTVTLADVPAQCRDLFSAEGGVVVGCSTATFVPDVWLADRAGKSRW